MKKTEPTVYIIDYIEQKVRTRADIRKHFINGSEEFRWDYCNSVDEYIYRMQKQGKMLVIENNGTIMSNKILSPRQYGQLCKLKIAADISLCKFDELTSKINCWNYPLSEYMHVVENELKVVVVKFSDGTYRFVEVPYC